VDAANAVVFAPDEGEIYEAGSVRLRVLAQSPGQPIAVTDNAVPPGFPGPVWHRHARMTDIFYVLEGELAFDLGGERRVVGAGGFVLVPPGVPHTFANPGPAPARFLNVYQPAGNEQYLKEAVRRMAEGRPWSPAEMAEVAARYDFEPVGADGSATPPAGCRAVARCRKNGPFSRREIDEPAPDGVLPP
jgi:mannose-6-phosphate isomerase-like protein (cupin superfamily)